jgi:hypothetical protein
MVARQRGATRIVIEGTSPRQAPPALIASRSAPRVASASGTAQMRLASQGTRQAAATPSGSRSERVAARTGQTRVAARTAPARVAPPAPRDDNRYFTEWYLRR